MIILLTRIEILQIGQHAGHKPELTETISGKEPVDVLYINLGSRWDQPL